VYALPLLALLARRESRLYGPRTRADLRLTAVAGLFFAIDLIVWARAIEDVGAGLATVLGNLQVVLVGVLAWAFLRERPERRMFVATPIVLIGVILISGVVGSGTYGRDPARGVVYGLLTAIAYAGFILCLRHGNNDLRRPAGPLFEATATAAVFALVLGAALGDLHVVPSWPEHGWLLLLALSSQVMGWLLISISLPRLPAAVTSVTLTTQPVGSVLLAVLIFSESPSVYQFIGVAVVLAGVLVASFRPRRAAAISFEASP
jgi:drug/metabolite transporter (DMT)-like permease